MMASSEYSTMEARRNNFSEAAPSFAADCLRSSTSAVMSRAMVEAPMIRPSLSFTGEMLTDTLMICPSFLRRTVS